MADLNIVFPDMHYTRPVSGDYLQTQKNLEEQRKEQIKFTKFYYQGKEINEKKCLVCSEEDIGCNCYGMHQVYPQYRCKNDHYWHAKQDQIINGHNNS